MAGTDTGFDAAAFRTAIRSAMTMGLPTDVAQQVAFVFSEAATYAATDPSRHPFDWTSATVTDVPARVVHIPAAVQWGLGTLNGTVVGEFDTSKAVVTVLDVDYAKVKGCDSVSINGTSYQIDTVGPPLGLFDVTVYQLYLTARG